MIIMIINNTLLPRGVFQYEVKVQKEAGKDFDLLPLDS